MFLKHDRRCNNNLSNTFAPYLNYVGTDFFGTDVDLSCYYSHVSYLFDWTAICKK
jgi:hypothetical protein